MKTSNKIEFKRTLLKVVVTIIIVSTLFGMFQYYQYKRYTINFNNKIYNIAQSVQEEYPQININSLIKILNEENVIKEDLFRNYGIEQNKDSIILENDMYFRKFTLINLTLLIICSLLVILIFIKYNSSKDKELKEIAKYIEEINNRNYKLNIDDNTEDELSILKNEIYKTTVMLKETAENSTDDKIKLKDSLSDISHQLKTPLTSITIMLDNILDNPSMDKDTREDFIKDIKREIININFLVNSLLKLSKLDVNSVKFINQKTKISDIIQESIKNVSVLCDLKNIKINVNGNEDIQIICDFKWQVEAITNILKNAIEHSEQDAQIDILYEQNKIYTKIGIKDYGIGIENKDLPHIFERFYKCKDSKSESVGIGLALTKAIIEKNNGYIKVESEPNKETVFTIKYFNGDEE